MAFQEQKTAEDASAAQKILAWVDARFPLTTTIKAHLTEYYAPKNFNFWYFFGSLALLVLGIQLISGIFLVMHYKPDALKAFQSVEYIMREVPWGWLIRYMHSTGASMFFVVIYCHIFRGLLYGSYRKPRELVWIFGCVVFLCLMAEAFMGYLLPWGQMSYWGAQVIVNLFASIPFVGPDLALWIRGDYVVSDVTLNRFFSFHVIAIPLVLIGLVVFHILALHQVGSNNPDGIEIKDKLDASGQPLDGISFHPYYSVHDLVGIAGFLALFSFIIFFAPEMGGYFLEANNFIPADPLKTPSHIAPVWYFTPFYSMLRATTSQFLIPIWLFVAVLLGLHIRRRQSGWKHKIMACLALALLALGFLFFDAKFWGVLVMGGSVLIFFFLPWLDNSPVRSMRFRPLSHKLILGLFVLVFLVLGYLGVQPPSLLGERIAQLCTLIYFAFFLVMPIWSQMGKFKAVPERVRFAPH